MTGPRIRRSLLLHGLGGFALGLSVACGGGGGGHVSVLTPNSVDVTVDRQAVVNSIGFSDEMFEADDCAFIEGSVDAVGLRRLLRFDTIIINYGELPVVLGDPSAPAPPLVAGDFEYSPCHDHFHFSGWADYELEDVTGTPVAFGHKQAFCLLDSLRYVVGQPSSGYDCDFQGISSGWADEYDRDLDGQWVDVTDIPEGDYTLVVTVNAVGKIPELLDLHPNTVRVAVHVPDPNGPP